MVLFHQLDAFLGICFGQPNARLDFQVELNQFTLQLQEVDPFALNFVYKRRKQSKPSFNINFKNPSIPNGFGFLAGAAATVGATAVGATFSILVVEVALFLAGDGATAGSSSSPSRYRFGLILRPLRLTTSGCGSFAGLATATASSFTGSSLTGAVFLGAAEGLSAAAVAFLPDFLLGSSLTGLAEVSLVVVAAAATLLSSPFLVSSFSDFMLLSTTVELAEMRDALKLAWKDRSATG